MAKKHFQNNYSAAFDTHDNRHRTGNFSDFDKSEELNKASLDYYINRLVDLSMSMFEWKNLPPTVDARYIENRLCFAGKAIYFRDEVVGDLCLDVNGENGKDVYGNPIRRTAISHFNSYRKDLTIDDSVIIYNNMQRTNTYPTLEYFAYRLWEFDRVIDINVKAQKTPILLKATQQQRMTVLNLYKEYDGNAPVIFGDKGLDPESIGVLRTDAPFVAQEVYTLREQLWNDALTFLGIYNSGTQKRERLVSEEATTRMGDVIASRYSRLESRRQAVDAINRMFGTDIEVNYREDVQNISLGMTDTYDDNEENGYETGGDNIE